MNAKEGILERLARGPVIGDGGITFTLEKRGYCKMGPYTPEALIEFPEAVKQLQREYARAGADIVQTGAFYSSDDKLTFHEEKHNVEYTVKISFDFLYNIVFDFLFYQRATN